MSVTKAIPLTLSCWRENWLSLRMSAHCARTGGAQETSMRASVKQKSADTVLFDAMAKQRLRNRRWLTQA